MPSPLAQADLIRDTYRRAGLDLSKPSDRPQYFEAHGTGTPAGDPVEAEAISTAFFGPASGFRRGQRDPKLYVGSVKTVIGHTEGTAGLAALLKASLAMQARRIPPNLHLHRLNPAIEPFYGDLEVPTALKEWPQPEPGHPLRASVNSFGFGGANAHAILESYEPPTSLTSEPDEAPPTAAAATAACAPVFAPFTFSANTESSLSKTLSSYKDHLELNPDTDLRNLAFTLNNHRSVLDKRAFVSAVDLDSLKEKLQSRSKEDMASSSGGAAQAAAPRPAGSRARILGVFTGQGAQWPRMGADLVLGSPAARAILEDLQDSLERLPSDDRPAWSLIGELLAPAESSRIHEAHISQTLYTAVQIMLVQLLRAAGVVFSTVVGHSSGEVPAAYTAGYLSARDAIRVSYYRGLNTHWAKGPGGEEGGMMAVGTSFQDAKELTELDAFAGRLGVGASNSSSSVTLSGDLDALQEAKDVLDAEGKFTRMLKVDKAYHSHHMLPCIDPYVRSLQDCGVVAHMQPEDSSCPWISSVYVRDMRTVTEDRVQDRYWSTNMTRPVMFSQALSYALGGEQPFDYIVEVGPHPALKGPASQTVQEVLGQKLPYAGCLRRGDNSVEALADCLGQIWSALGPSCVDFAGYESFLSGNTEQRLLSGLPSYPWDHDRSYHFKSRLSKAILNEGTPTNELLGVRGTNNSASQAQWRNSLHPGELPWLLQHHAQGQTVFPGMGYVSAALEAANQLFGGGDGDQEIRTVEIRDLVIGHALVIEENVGAETVFSVTGITRRAAAADGRVIITAHFAFLSHQGNDPTKLTENASGELHVVLGQSAKDALPGKLETDDGQLKDLDEERFYSSIASLGYGYTGPFRALKNLQRRMGAATGLLAIPQQTPFFEKMLAHPAALDATVQSILAAYCFPGDTRLRGIHLPTGVDCIRFNFAHCLEQMSPGAQLPFWASVALTDDETQDVGGDVDLYSQCGRFTLIQLQGLHTKPLSPLSAEKDLHLFSEVVWKPESPEGSNLELHGESLATEGEMFEAMERVAYFYMRTLRDELPPGNSRRDLAQHHVRFLEWADHVRDRVAKGTLPHIKGDHWDGDTSDDIRNIVARFPESIDLQLMSAVGENLPRVFAGEINALEPMVQDNMLNRFYVDAMGMSQYTEDLARMVAHLTHRYPHMKILEVGAGTGGATKVMLRRLDNAFASYTYTDISNGFFGEAREVFRAYESRMVFRTLDIERDVVEQGYEEHSFDVVVANLVVHATRNLEATLMQLRRLVKPGGYLLLLEITNNDPLRFGFIFGGLPGWWLGCEDDGGNDNDHDGGRVYSPCVGVARWDEVMRKTGFSGVDTLTPDHALGPLSVILTQAVDERVAFLRQPLSSTTSSPSASPLVDAGHLTIVGGAPQLTDALQHLMQPHYKHISVIPTIELVPSRDLPIMGTVLSLVELDSPIFRDMTSQKLAGFKQVFQQSKNVYWITRGACSGQDPHANMVIGVGRTIVLEMKHVRLGFLDFTRAEDADAQKLGEKLLQFEASGAWGDQQQEQKQEGAPAVPPLTWYQEPELRFEAGQFLIPRIRLSKDRNARYNAKTRHLAHEVDPRLQPVGLTARGQSLCLALQEASSGGPPLCAETRPDILSITVSYAMLRSVRLPSSDYLFLILGTDNATGKHVFAFADSHRSVVEVDRQWTLPCAMPLDRARQVLVSMYEQIMAQTAVGGLELGDSVVVLDGTTSMAEALDRRCADKGIRATFLTTRSDRQNREGIYIHPLTPTRCVEEVLPPKVSRLLDMSDFSTGGDSGGDAVRLVAKCIPSKCQRESLDSLTDTSAHITTQTFVGLDCAVPDVLRACWAHARSIQGSSEPPLFTLVTPTDVTEGNKPMPADPCLMVDWTSASRCAVRIQPADSVVRFRQDRTYWLVGLTGGLGLSLCRWMVERGARYVVMTSRNPSIDQKWLRGVEALGAKVKISSK
jgi:hybrid polyketide synthase / nonribosomal peptide synthetase ACE1